MFKSVMIINDVGDSIVTSLGDPERTGLLITNIGGLGPVKSSISTTEVSSRDGVYFNGARMSSRNITFDIKYMNYGNETIEQVRIKSYKYFPIKKKITLVFYTDTRSVYIEGYVESNEPTIFSNKETTRISIICPDPYFKGITEQTTYFNGVAASFEFPFESASSADIEFGEIVNYTENNIYYEGSEETGITIILHFLSDVENLKIYNTRTREMFGIDDTKLETITGSKFKAGDDVYIITSRGNKKALLLRDGIYTNILNTVVKNSSWLTLSVGDNLFAYTVSKGQRDVMFKVTNEILYEGI